MFARISLLAVSLILGFCALGVFSGPLANAELSRRQIGDYQCNVDRLFVTMDVPQIISNVEKLASAGASDPAVTNATTTALEGLDSAQQAIDTIIHALFEGQTVPADARKQVEQGLITAQDSLDSIHSTDTAVISALSDAQTTLQNAELALQGIVVNCK
ncbi:hypothetical protein PNOK_0512600 [Pyrrhoderma noxium]|uniref:Uncharacterized protein n=1 Tax=Pyrrhoderma noxium TaxID=2282107 RepID=A0A286UKU3_9AGAM|nr:hypothetical protein PNOK_0512600 [Pyrrhoderma noxium]